MKEPTKEQLKEFWEWCGEHVHDFSSEDYGLLGEVDCKTCGKSNLAYDDDSGHMWHYIGELPHPLDLNNLFKYAVPKLDFAYIEWDGTHYECDASMGEKFSIRTSSKDPALALFQAMWEVISEN